MRILIFYPLFPPKWLGGIEIASYNISNQLAMCGHDVHVITSLDNGMPNISKNGNIHVYRLYWWKIRIIGTLLLWFKTFFKIMVIRPDIIHIQAIGNGIPGFLAKRFLRIPYVIWGQGSDIYMPWAFKNPISKIVLSNADAVIALTNDMKKKMQKLYMRDISVIPNGIFVKQFTVDYNKLSVLRKNKKLLFVGRLNPVKGVKYLIQTMNIIRNNGYNAKLTIVGDGEDKQELQQLVKDLNLGEYIDFIGRVENKEIPKYMANADIFVLPSLSESFGIVNLEAMACGLPIVATRVGGLPEIIEDGVNGFLVEPRNSGQLAKKIILLLNDDKLRMKIKKTNKEKAEQYDWSNIIIQLEGIYSSVLVT